MRFELGAERFELLPAVFLYEQVERGDSGGHRDRVTRERAGLVCIPVRREPGHDLARAAESADGHAAADDLAEGRQVGAIP